MTQSLGAVALNTLLVAGLLIGTEFGVIGGLWPWALLIVVTIPLGWVIDDTLGRGPFAEVGS